MNQRELSMLNNSSIQKCREKNPKSRITQESRPNHPRPALPPNPPPPPPPPPPPHSRPPALPCDVTRQRAVSHGRIGFFRSALLFRHLAALPLSAILNPPPAPEPTQHFFPTFSFLFLVVVDVDIVVLIHIDHIVLIMLAAYSVAASLGIGSVSRAQFWERGGHGWQPSRLVSPTCCRSTWPSNSSMQIAVILIG